MISEDENNRVVKNCKFEATQEASNNFEDGTEALLGLEDIMTSNNQSEVEDKANGVKINSFKENTSHFDLPSNISLADDAERTRNHSMKSEDSVGQKSL